jgi:Winged helix-turn helix
MRRTEALQGVRMTVFLTLLPRWESAELNQAEVAELLGVSERTFRRWRDRYDEDGAAGLIDRRLGKASGRRVPADRAEEVGRLYRERLPWFYGQAFPRASGEGPWFRLMATPGSSCICNGRALFRRRRARGRIGASASAVPCRA